MTAFVKRHITVLLLTATTWAMAQKAGQADRYYFEYNYPSAIAAYEQLRQTGELSPQQRLNLADAYFRTDRFDRASELFLESYRRDSLMDNHHFNSMMQALSRTSGKDRVQAFLSTRSTALSEELLENASFNYELLESAQAAASDHRIFKLQVNSAQMDMSPAFYGPDRILFSSARPQDKKETYQPSGQGYLDIYVAVREADGQLRGASPITWLPKSSFHASTPFFSPGLNGIFYVRSNTENGQMTFDENGKNALAVALGKRDGTDNLLLRDPGTSFYYPFYDDATQRLYFAADFDQGYGGTDLYYVSTNEGRIMSAPVNLGPRINTPGNEISPFIMEGSLFFASDVFYGLGGMDLYKADIQEEGVFSIPVNLGTGINTEYDEFGFILEAGTNGYQGYFASNRPGGSGSDDLYGFSASGKPGLKTLVVRGNVLSSATGDGLEKARVRMFDADGTTLKESYTRADGSFFVEIPYREGVAVAVSKERFTGQELGRVSELEAGKALSVSLTPLESYVRDRDGQMQLRAERFYFDRGSVRITSEIAAFLNPAAEALKAFPQMRIRVEAHTDSRGASQSNLDLSRKRATAIRDYLISQGVASEQIPEAEGLGETQIVNNCTDGVYCLEILHRQNERYLLIVQNFDSL